MAAVCALLLDDGPHLANFYLGHLGGIFTDGAVVAHSVYRKILGMGMETTGKVFLVLDAFECMVVAPYGSSAVLV